MVLGGQGGGVYHNVQHKAQETLQEDSQSKATEKGIHHWATEQLHLLIWFHRHVVDTQDGREEQLLHAPFGQILANFVDKGDSSFEAGLGKVKEGH